MPHYPISTQVMVSLLGLVTALTGCSPTSSEVQPDPAAPEAAMAQPTPTSTSACKPDISGLIVSIDTDKDGKLTEAEWKEAGLPASAFKMLSRGQGFVDPVFWRADTPPSGIDMNGDCVITQAEFQAFDKMRSAEMSTKMKPSNP